MASRLQLNLYEQLKGPLSVSNATTAKWHGTANCGGGGMPSATTPVWGGQLSCDDDTVTNVEVGRCPDKEKQATVRLGGVLKPDADGDGVEA
jgi:hypothetical protein